MCLVPWHYFMSFRGIVYTIPWDSFMSFHGIPLRHSGLDPESVYRITKIIIKNEK